MVGKIVKGRKANFLKSLRTTGVAHFVDKVIFCKDLLNFCQGSKKICLQVSSVANFG